MRPQAHLQNDIDEFFIDQMSPSELILEELEERELITREQREEDEEMHELDEWLQSLYGRGIRPPRLP